jgi:hypothetical protein
MTVMSGDRSDHNLMRRIRRGMRLCKPAGLLCRLAMPALVVPVFCEAAEITPKVVWKHDRVDCDAEQGDLTCVIKAMRAGDASSAAIRFAQVLASRDDPGWAIEFRELGRIDLLTSFHPYRVNTNNSFSLVNGSPELIEVGSYQLTQADFARADVQPLLRRNPNAFLIYKLWFLGRRETVAGGSRFVFSGAFADCRVCKPLAGADIAYDFDSRGVFHGAKLLRVAPRQF